MGGLGPEGSKEGMLLPAGETNVGSHLSRQVEGAKIMEAPP
jgi:hypothetical protein